MTTKENQTAAGAAGNCGKSGGSGRSGALRGNPARYRAMFERLARAGEGAFVPFVNLCDPSPERSPLVLEALARGGADALELGIPFSDPTADGPVLEDAAHRAISNGSTVEKCLAVAKGFRAAHPTVPMSLMLYANLVEAAGAAAFFERAAEAGVDVILIPDLPLSMREAEPAWDEAAAAAGIGLAAIAPPDASDAVLAGVAKRSAGYVYLLSRVGITGADREAEMPAPREVAELKRLGAAPLLLGFGVSRPEHVRAALAAGADGVVVGSAIGLTLNAHLDEDDAVLASALEAHARRMKAAASSGPDA